MRQKKCKKCGNVFDADDARVTCSPECSKELKRRQHIESLGRTKERKEKAPSE